MSARRKIHSDRNPTVAWRFMVTECMPMIVAWIISLAWGPAMASDQANNGSGTPAVWTNAANHFPDSAPAPERAGRLEHPGVRAIDSPGLWTVAAIITISLLGLVAWNWKLAREIRNRKQAEEALRHTQALLTSITEGTSDTIYAKDRQGRYLMFNAAAARIVGKPRGEVLGKDDAALFSADEARQIMEGDQRVMAYGSMQTYEELVTLDGVTRTYLSAKGPMRDAQGKVIGLFGITRDITERRQTEESLRRTNRALRLISECNQALMRATDEAELLQAICRITVEHGPYRMAWVGFAEQNPTRSVRPVAQAGFEAGYLDTVNITWADTERGGGPTGTAIRTGRVVIARNIPTDPALGPWRAAAIQRGYASLAALPLTDGGKTFGALMVYSGNLDAFNAEEVELLGELTANLAYGIIALRASAERAQAEAALRSREENFRSLAEAMPQIVWATRPDGSNIYFNQQWVDYTGLTMEESCGQGWIIPFHPDDQQRTSDAWRQATQTGGTYSLESRLRRADGTYHWWLIRGVPLRDDEGKILKWFGTCTDIENIKQAETAIQLALTEKTALLKEIHHRVKNNLAIMASLINMQVRRIEHPDALAALTNTRAKLSSMALLHEMLYRSGRMDQVEIQGYLELLCAHLAQSLDMSAHGIQIQSHTTVPLTLEIDQAVPCGLIVNELVTNAVKHAFPDARQGKVLVEFEVAAADAILLRVADNGIGLPDSLKTDQIGEVGLALVNALTQQLQGTLEIRSEHGSIFEIRFPLRPPNHS